MKYAEKLVTRRQNDVKDEVDEISGKPNTGDLCYNILSGDLSYNILSR